MSKLLKYAILVAIATALFIAPQQARAATCASFSGGNWSNPSIWNCGHVPGPGDIVGIFF